MNWQTARAAYRGVPTTIPRPLVATLPSAATPFLLGTWESVVPIPMEVALSAEANGSFGNLGAFPPQNAPALAGNIVGATVSDPQNAGYFQIEYGFGGLVRTRIVDLRSARIFLGVCDSVRVTAVRWRGSTAWVGNSYPDLLCAAAIGPAQGGAYDELISSQQILLASGATANGTLVPPLGATHYEVSAVPLNVPAAGILWGSAQPDLNLYGEENFAFRFSNNAIVPPYRRIKSGGISISVISTANFTISVVLTASFILNS